MSTPALKCRAPRITLRSMAKGGKRTDKRDAGHRPSGDE